MTKTIVTSILVFFSIIIVIEILDSTFLHILINEKYMHNLWQYILTVVFSLILIYPITKLKESLILIIVSLVISIILSNHIFNRLIIVFIHLVSEKQEYQIITKITDKYRHGQKGCWATVRIVNYKDSSNEVCISKGNKDTYKNLKKENTIYLNGYISNYGFTYNKITIK